MNKFTMFIVKSKFLDTSTVKNEFKTLDELLDVLHDYVVDNSEFDYVDIILNKNNNNGVKYRLLCTVFCEELVGNIDFINIKSYDMFRDLYKFAEN